LEQYTFIKTPEILVRFFPKGKAGFKSAISQVENIGRSNPANDRFDRGNNCKNSSKKNPVTIP